MLGVLWAMFAIDLGGRTFAEHMDTISETPEAQELVEGARATVNPALVELRDRVLGEYVEAPTWIPDPEGLAGAAESEAPQVEPVESAEPVEPRLPGQRAPSTEASATLPARTLDPFGDDASFEPALPGRRQPTALDHDPSLEPALPGRR